MLYITSYALLLSWLSWEDIKHLRISVYSLAILGVLAISEHLHYPVSHLGISLFGGGCILIGLKILNYMLLNFTKIGGMGSGDIWLLSILAFRLSADQLPLFIFLSGLFACVWGCVLRQRKGIERFPVVPAISTSFLVIRMFC